jgi:hypothetical protein
MKILLAVVAFMFVATQAPAQGLLVGGGNSPQAFYANPNQAEGYQLRQLLQKRQQQQAVAARRGTKR